MEAGKTQRPAVVQRNVDRAFQFVVAALSGAGPDVTFEFIGIRPGRQNRHCAGRGIASEQQTLRPLQHLDPVEIVETGHHHAVAALVNPILVNSHRRVTADAEVVGNDAAHRHVVDVAVLGAPGDTRRQLDQILDVLNPRTLEKLGAVGRDADRHVLQRFLAFLRGDHNLFDRDRVAALLRLHDTRRRHDASDRNKKRPAQSARSNLPVHFDIPLRDNW